VKAYYNEINSFSAAWLRNLIDAGLVAPGEVDERSIADVTANDLSGFRQVHLFAGIGGWSFALRLAGVPDDFPIWTGSCPCQAFSAAGRGKGFKDERHLWPEMFRLIKACKPEHVIGEQVERAIGHGWLDLVFDDLDREDYASGAVVLPACCIGARCIRQRIWWAANLDLQGREIGQGIAANAEFSGQRTAVADSGNTRWGDRWATEPSVGRVVHGVQPGNPEVVALGNSIVPQLAAEFITAYLETQHKEQGDG